jgi:hypothetical protein
MKICPVPRNTKQFCAYLAGAIEHSPDGGVAWRREVERELDRLGHAYYDATLVECDLLEPEEKGNFLRWKSADFARFRRAMRKVIDHDLGELLGRADYVIVYWEEWTRDGGGTHGEITLAYRAGIPVYLVATIPVEQVSGWILGCCEAVFESFPSLFAHLEDTCGPQA